MDPMASYSVNKRAVARARKLIDAHQYVLDSTWGDVQPSAEDENVTGPRRVALPEGSSCIGR